MEAFFKKYLNTMVAVIICSLLSIFITYSVCNSRRANLENGENVIATIDGKEYTSNDYYNLLIESDNLTNLLRKIDLDILKDKYSDSENEASEYATNTYNSMYSDYLNNNPSSSESDFLKAYSYKDKDSLINYLKNDYYIYRYEKEYTKANYDSTKLQNFYGNSVYNSKDLYIFVGTSLDDMKSVKKLLDSNENVKSVMTKYASVTSKNLNYYYNDGSFTDDQVSAINELKEKETSSILNYNNSGYILFYVDNISSKPSLDECKDTILDYLVGVELSQDQSLSYKATLNLQKENNIKFYDSVLEEKYNDLVNKYK